MRRCWRVKFISHLLLIVLSNGVSRLKNDFLYNAFVYNFHYSFLDKTLIEPLLGNELDIILIKNMTGLSSFS